MWRGMNVSFRDMLFLLVFAYLVISAVALAYVSKNKDESKGAAAPGNVQMSSSSSGVRGGYMSLSAFS